MKLLVATTNLKKLEELKALLADLPLTLLTLRDFPDCEEVPETGRSFEENASQKALGYARRTGFVTLGEDSGLCCDALEGAPGIYSARFAGEHKRDADNNAKLLKLLRNLPDNCRSAHYISAVAIANSESVLAVLKGEVHGFITRELKGSGGFGYDPLFYYPPFGKTFAEVPAAMKHEVSHRAQALKKLKVFLRDYLKQRPDAFQTKEAR